MASLRRSSSGDDLQDWEIVLIPALKRFGIFIFGSPKSVNGDKGAGFMRVSQEMEFDRRGGRSEQSRQQVEWSNCRYRQRFVGL